MQMRPEEDLEEREANIESTDAGSEDMDGDGSLDWDPAVGPGVQYNILNATMLPIL